MGSLIFLPVDNNTQCVYNVIKKKPIDNIQIGEEADFGRGI